MAVVHKARQVFYLPHEQCRQLQEISVLTGANLSEIARRMLGPALTEALLDHRT